MTKFSLLFLLLSVVFFSCKNDEGEGGSSTVQGYVYKIIHTDNNYSLSTDTVPAAKEDIFIVYGDDNFYGDDLKTDENGFYKFKYLVDGSYKLFTYNSYPEGQKEVVATSVNVEKNKTAKADTLYIHTGDAFGTSIIKGVIKVKYYHKGDYINEVTGVGQRVFICHTGENIPFDDVRSGINGVFGFEKIKPGIYDIYSISENPDTEVEFIEPDGKQTIEVTATDSIYELPETITIKAAV